MTDDGAIENEAEFNSLLQMCLERMDELRATYPKRNKLEILSDIELQLDIMRRRTADGGVPTTLERERITIAGLTKFHFPVAERKPPAHYLMSVMCDLAHAYQNWEEVPT